jgi:hypothetical protein
MLCVIAAATLLACPPAAAHAAPPVSPEMRLPHFSSSGNGYSTRWVTDRTLGFGFAGFELLGTDVEPVASGWRIGGGAEFPAGRDWSLVTRADAVTSSVAGTSSLWWARAVVAGRLSWRSGDIVHFTEAGVGLGVLDETRDAFFSTPRGAETSAAPVAHLATGLHGRPELGPTWLIEATLDYGFHRTRPCGFGISLGLEF